LEQLAAKPAWATRTGGQRATFHRGLVHSGTRRRGAILDGMYALKGHVKNGQIVLDEPTELPEGMQVRVQVYNPEGDTLNDEERAALHRSLERGIAQADAGELIDADEVLAELER